MKRLLGCLCILLFLCGCSKTDPGLDVMMDLRQSLLSCNECNFVCTITAHFEDYLFTFKMNCTSDTSGNMHFTIIEPETISGITGNINEKSTAITFDDTVLAFELLADGEFSPVASPWILMRSLRAGYIHAVNSNDNSVQAFLDDSYEENPMQLTVWLDSNRLPQSADIYWQNRRILSLEISNFTIQ